MKYGSEKIENKVSFFIYSEDEMFLYHLGSYELVSKNKIGEAEYEKRKYEFVLKNSFFGEKQKMSISIPVKKKNFDLEYCFEKFAKHIYEKYKNINLLSEIGLSQDKLFMESYENIINNNVKDKRKNKKNKKI